MLNRSRIRIPRQALRHGQLADLPQLEIPDAVSVPFGDPASPLFAIGISAINNGLNVFVPPYPGMYPGDYIEVFWDNSGVPVAGQPVTQSNVNQTIGLTVPYGSFANGRFTPYYRITRSSTVQVYSVTRDIWVKLTRPGNFDPNPATPEHEALLAPILPDDVRDGLDDLRARLGVDVTIEPYPFMAEYDRIDFSWGGVRRVYTVQPGEAGQPIVVHITEADILAAGDGQVLLMYTVIDAALNRTTDAKWSLSSSVDVDTSAHLDEPYVEEADPITHVLDLAELGDNDATAVVYAPRGGDFAIGDTIELTWAGFDSHGATLTPHVSSLIVTRIPGAVNFSIPNAVVAASTQGRAIVSYVLRKQSGQRLNSRRATVRITGEAVPDLLEPIVTQNQGGTLPADIARANVTVRAYPGMGEGDHVTLIWAGRRADGTPTDVRPTFDVTQAWVGRDLPFTIDGPTEIAPLAGGSVTVYYQVDYAGGTALVRESEHLDLAVDAVAGQLPRPSVIEAPNGVFDPTLALATVSIPGAPLVANDRVTMSWRGDVTGLHTDSGVVRTTGQPMNFMVGADDITGNRQITVTYNINGGPASSTLTLLASAAGELRVPVVEQANNGVLRLTDIPAAGAIAHVRPYDRIDLGDRVTLYLEEPAGNVRWQLQETVTSTTQDLLYTIPRSVLVGLLNRTVQLRYTVQFDGGGSDTSAPANLRIEEGGTGERPVITSVRNTQTGQEIPDNGNTSATALTFKGTAKRNERVELFDGNVSRGTDNVNPNGDWELQVSVLGGGAHTFTAVGLYDDFPESDPRRLTVTLSGHLLVMGGRSPTRKNKYFGMNLFLRNGRQLHALDATTGKPILARWRYEHEAVGTTVTAKDFPDTQPDAVLYVDTDDDQKILRPKNILGDGRERTYSGTSPGGAFAALRDQGNLVAWGNPIYGGNIGGTIPGLTDIVQFEASPAAFIARRSNGTGSNEGAIVAWGSSTEGGVIPGSSGIPSMTDFVDVIGSCFGFTALRSNGQVVAWGASADTGGVVPDNISRLTDIVEVTCTNTAFAARRRNRAVVAWGSSSGGGTFPNDSVIPSLTDIVEVVGNNQAFAARRENGSVVVWGNTAYGGAFPNGSLIPGLTDIVEVIGNSLAFAARRKNNSVVVWGGSTHGGAFPDGSAIPGLTDIIEVVSNWESFAARRTNGAVVAWGAGGGTLPTDISGMTDIIEVVPSYRSFAARRSNGAVVAWGSAGTGGTVPNDIAGLTDIVDVVGNYHAFAALRSNGQVVAWGNTSYGGAIPASIVPLLTNVRAIYPNWGAFAALTKDGRVVVWGHGSYGGTNNTVPSNLNGNISYELKAGITQDDGPCIGPAKTPRKRGKKLPT